MNYSYPSFIFFPSANTIPNPNYQLTAPSHYPIFAQHLPSPYQPFGNYIYPNNQIPRHPPFSDETEIMSLENQRNNPRLDPKIDEQKTEQKMKRIKKVDARKESHKSSDNNSQNCRRNVITNLGNQLLAFIGSKFKLSMLLLKVSEEVSESSVNSLMAYIKKVKKEVKTYLNLDKMKEYWFQTHGDQHLEQLLILFRKVSYYYLINYGRLQVAKSIKMKRETKKYHLEGLRLLTSVLRREFLRH